MKILGVRIDNFSKKEILEKIGFFLNENKFHQIATVNPEFILQAQKNKEFKSVLNSCDLNIADGIGLKYAFARYGGWLKNRIAGVDLMHEILRIANEKILSVFLAINKDGLSSYEEIKTALEKKYPNVEFYGEDVYPVNFFSYKIRNTKYDILLCNFGFPQQEKFLNFTKNDTISLAMGVGGSFDFVTGKLRRAPKIMRDLGLEWLWRFAQEPKYRFKRIIDAVIVFPIKIILSKQEND